MNGRTVGSPVCNRWRSMLFGVGAIVVSVWSTSGCGDPSTRPAARWQSAVVGGERSSAEHDGVVMISLRFEDGAWAVCTATLVSPWILMTAKHCIAPVKPGEFVCTGGGEVLDDGSGAGTFGAAAPADSIDVQVGVAPPPPVTRGAAVYATESEHACRNDVAVVVLERPIDWVPVVPIRQDPAVRIGESVTLLGYGADEDSTEFERRVLHGVRVLDVGALSSAEMHPNPMLPPRSFAVGGAPVTEGDSGGPALDQDGQLVGICSQFSKSVQAEAGRNTYYMMAASYLGLVDRAQAALEAQGVIAGQDENDAAGAGGEPAVSTRAAPVRAGGTSTEPAAASPSSDALRCQATGGSASTGAATSGLGWVCAIWMALRRRRVCVGAGCRGAPVG